VISWPKLIIPNGLDSKVLPALGVKIASKALYPDGLGT
jgi:hypothetical protein